MKSDLSRRLANWTDLSRNPEQVLFSVPEMEKLINPQEKSTYFCRICCCYKDLCMAWQPLLFSSSASFMEKNRNGLSFFVESGKWIWEWVAQNYPQLDSASVTGRYSSIRLDEIFCNSGSAGSDRKADRICQFKKKNKKVTPPLP